MRVIIAGSRCISEQSVVDHAMTAARLVGIEPTVVLSGGAAGVDACGEAWAAANGVTVERYPALWDKHGTRAGPIRNRQMAKKADALVAIWWGDSPGTRSMIAEASKVGILIAEFKLKRGEE